MFGEARSRAGQVRVETNRLANREKGHAQRRASVATSAPLEAHGFTDALERRFVERGAPS